MTKAVNGKPSLSQPIKFSTRLKIIFKVIFIQIHTLT